MSETEYIKIRIPAWLYQLVGYVYLDFTVKRNLDFCRERLTALEWQNFWGNSVIVKLNTQDTDTYNFNLTRRPPMRRTLAVKANGLIQRKDSDVTHCSAQVQIASVALVQYVILIALVFILIPFSSSLEYLLILIVGIGIHWFNSRRKCHEYARTIEKALRK